jgi:hypothetical protein
MVTKRTVYHVMPNLPVDEWVVSREDDASFCELYPTKEAAVLAANRRALHEGAAQVKVHEDNGDIEDQ